MINFVKGDQFVGFNVSPTNGDLIFRYAFVVTDVPDGNGRGVTRRVMEQNKTIARGRPLIFAPNEVQGGTKGHTDFLTTDPYKYEVGRIVSIEPATKNLYNRLKQTSSSYNDILKNESNLWVMDVVITNEKAKQIWLNPATSHLIPRYVSPSFIHKRNPSGDYSRVDDAVLDHVAIVNKPLYDPMSGKQIDGAAYGEVTTMRGACFGDRLACLNLLQTSSNKNRELDKSVCCPTQLLDRLTHLYLDTTSNYYIDIVQTGSSSDMSSNTNQSSDTAEVVTGTTTTTTATNQQPNQSTATVTTSNPLSNFFKSDDQLQNQYAALKQVVTQIMKETQPNSTMIDGNKQPSEQTAQGGEDSTTVIDPTKQTAESVKTGETQQEQQLSPQTTQMMQELQKKLNLSEDEIKNMKIEDIKTRFADINRVVATVMEEQQKTAKTLEQIRTKEEKGRIANILPKEAFTDERGFKEKEFQEVVDYIHKVKLADQYITILGVGLIAMRNEQSKIRDQKNQLKKNPATLFGDSLKLPQPEQTATITNQ